MKTISKAMMMVSVGLVITAAVSVLDRGDPSPVATSTVEVEAEGTTPRIGDGPRVGDDDAAERRAARIFRIAAKEPSLRYDEIDALVEQSDQMRAQAEAEGEDELGDEVRRRLAEVEIDEGEAVAWFEQHRERFGSRSFEQSRHTVERLMAIERVREEFELL